ncbi:MAG: radical SAM protein [Clostridiales Family XIII bacterium]|nr:radical SAM protein [Clostridiales Family XIII bacterium]
MTTDTDHRILSKTQSLCPVCLKPVDACYAESGGKTYFRKSCPEHGEVSVLVADDAADYVGWSGAPVVNIAPKTALTKGREGECPLCCGTCDLHLQTACCVLLDVTGRCNQSCPWCFARAGGTAGDDPGLDAIEGWYDRLLELGEERPFNIQLSGGEPTVRDDLPEIARMGREKGFDYIQLNTNGRRIAEEGGYAEKLKGAGVSVAFLQFDGTRDDIYEKLRGEPLLDLKRRAIEACRRARLPVTLVPTLLDGVNLDDIGGIIGFMLERLDVVKGVHFQPASFFGRHGGQPDGMGDFRGRVTMFDVMRGIESQTGGLFSREDLLPISTGHPLCCFSGSYLREGDGSIRSLMGAAQRAEGASCCCQEPDPLEIIRKDRDFVLNKWDMGEGGEGGESHMGFDEFISYIKRNRFTLTGMAFQDIGNLDAERLKRCRVQVFTGDGRLVPFCAYNSVYRGR